MPRSTRFQIALVVVALLPACGGGDGLAAPTDVQTPTVSAAQLYVDDAVTLMQRNAFYRSRVDWSAVRFLAHVQSAGAITPAATYPAIRIALAALGDHHSFLQPPATSAFAAERALLAEAAAHPADSLDGELLGGRYGYLHVPTFGIALGTPNFAQRVSDFADTLQALVRAVDAGAPCGWVVDLRHNSGGNMWPMMVGVGPILGTGSSLGAFIDADGGATTWWYNDGSSGITSPAGARSVVASLSRASYTLKQPDPPVAVLTDSLTASSGEAVTVAFRGRAATRSFGADTYGVPTSNYPFPLSDGAFLFIMTSLDQDRTGRKYDTRIPPDEPVEQRGAPATDDATVAAATAWLAAQASCVAR